VRYLPVEPLARYVLGPPSEGSALEGG
jgi:hypothetical protein